MPALWWFAPWPRPPAAGADGLSTRALLPAGVAGARYVIRRLITVRGWCPESPPFYRSGVVPSYLGSLRWEGGDVDGRGQDPAAAVTGRAGARQRRLPGGRRHKFTVRLSEQELQTVQDRAAAAGISIPRLMVEATLAGDAQTASERRAVVVELLAVRRLALAVGNNLNQVARVANATGQVPPELSATLHATARAIGRIDAVAEALGRPRRRTS